MQPYTALLIVSAHLVIYLHRFFKVLRIILFQTCPLVIATMRANETAGFRRVRQASILESHQADERLFLDFVNKDSKLQRYLCEDR
jgi:hypothetical protein